MIRSEVNIPKVWRSEISGIAWFIFLGIISVVLSHSFPQLVIKGRLFAIGSYHYYLFLPVLWFLPLISLMISIYKIYDVEFTIDGRGVQAKVGKLSVKQRINRIRYEDIRAIDIHQTILERMLDIGTLEIGTAASADTEVILSGIAAPSEVKDKLEKERDGRLNARKNAQAKGQVTSASFSQD